MMLAVQVIYAAKIEEADLLVSSFWCSWFLNSAMLEHETRLPIASYSPELDLFT